MKSRIILLSLLLLSCINNNLPQSTISPSSSTSSYPIVSSSSTPNVSLYPSTVPTSKPLEEENSINKKFNIGIFRTFTRITDGKSPDKILEKRSTINIINDLNVESVVIDLNQNIIDRDLDGNIEEDSGDLNLYKEIIENLSNKKVYIRINYNQLPSTNTIPRIGEFLSYFDKLNEKLKDYKNIYWIIEDKINNKNLNPEPDYQIIDFVKKTSFIIKKYNKKSKVYLGSMMQSEIFSKRISYTPDNLLNYLNLGVSDSCDGFILEFYNVINSNSFLPSDYRLISNYFNLLSNVLKLKDIKNKELILVTSTYSGNILSRQEEDKNEKNVFYNIGDLQTEQQQAGLIVRNIVYGIYSGFEYIFLPKIFDDDKDSIIEVIKRSGIMDEISETQKDLEVVRRKLSYWTVKFLNKLLSGSKFVKKINTSYLGIEVFLFENSDKYFYIVWNNFNERNDTINIPIENTKGILYTLPYDDNTKEGVSIPFNLDKKELGISFSRNSYIPRIIEVEK